MSFSRAIYFILLLFFVSVTFGTYLILMTTIGPNIIKESITSQYHQNYVQNVLISKAQNLYNLAGKTFKRVDVKKAKANVTKLYESRRKSISNICQNELEVKNNSLLRESNKLHG
jgi:hypothetical protein